ncbi:MAG: sigma-70 family RNA polymerase sigma factor [Hyphomonadaceae bacterium]|nr:sigma-70 family RNA polymerase sigma factor [Hyphomonadaceae bacterium]
MQETLVALHTRRDSYDPNYPLTAWMYAIARYRLIDFLRRAKHRATSPIDGLEIGDADPEIEASDARRDVAALLGRLPEKQRRAIQLVKLEEKSVREAAEETGFSESDIKISIHRGLKTLMRLMGQEHTT